MERGKGSTEGPNNGDSWDQGSRNQRRSAKAANEGNTNTVRPNKEEGEKWSLSQKQLSIVRVPPTPEEWCVLRMENPL